VPNRTSSCLSFPADFDNDYPLFVYRSGNPEACSIVELIESAVPHAVSRIFLGNATNATAFEVNFSSNHSIQYEGHFDVPSLVEFVDEWSLKPFGDWPLRKGFESSRRFLFFVTEVPDGLSVYVSALMDFVESVVAGSIDRKGFRDLWSRGKVDKVVIIAFDESKEKFGVFEPPRYRENFPIFLSQLINGTHDSLMTFNSSDLFPPAPPPSDAATSEMTINISEGSVPPSESVASASESLPSPSQSVPSASESLPSASESLPAASTPVASQSQSPPPQTATPVESQSQNAPSRKAAALLDGGDAKKGAAKSGGRAVLVPVVGGGIVLAAIVVVIVRRRTVKVE